MSGRTSKKQDGEEQQNESRSQSQGSQQQQRKGGRRRQSNQRESDNQQQEQQDGHRSLESGETFRPAGAARVGLLRLARKWRGAGNVHAAIYAYEQVLARYSGTSAANAAAEELIDLAEELEGYGWFYTALNIFNKVEARS